MKDELRTDIAVIGSGPGGAIVAATLAQAGKEVLLVEEGPYLPQGSATPFSFEEMTQKYRASGITATFGNPNIAYAEGRCVGGGSEVNSGMYHRTPDEVLNYWQTAFSIDQMNPESLQVYFEQCDEVMQPKNYPGDHPASSVALKRGAEKLGWQSTDIPRLVDFETDKDPQNVEISRRRSMSETYIPLFMEKEGRLLPESRVDRLERTRGGQWRIHGRHKSTPIKISAHQHFCLLWSYSYASTASAQWNSREHREQFLHATDAENDSKIC